MNTDKVLNDALKIIEDMIFDGTIEMLGIDYKDDEQEWLDHIDSTMIDEYNCVMNDRFNVNFDKIKNRIEWHIGDRFKDEWLINQLIEEQIANEEERLDERLKSEE